MWVLDLKQERIHNANPGDFESMFIIPGDSEMKEGLTIEEATESLGRASVAF